MKGLRKSKMCKRGMAFLLAVVMVLSMIMVPGSNVQAAGTTIQSMSYYSAADGPVITGSGVGEASYGFVMPIFNGGASTWADVADDLSVKVKDNGSYKDIDSVSKFVYNQNWGHWNDSGISGYWFTVSETTYLQLYSKSTGVTLDYTLEFTNINTTTIKSMAYTQGPELTAGPTGSIGFTYPTFNGDSSIPYAAVADDLKVYVKSVNSSTWVDIDNNAASGWIYDQNFGQFTDGPGGYWFTLTESINVKLESKSSGASLVYTLNYNQANRSNYTVTAYDGTTTYTAGEDGAIGFPLPKIGGTDAYQADLENFIYEVKINGNWVELSDYSKSTFNYAGNGYNTLSDKNQWGYWVDYIYGLWFQPLQEDYELRIGYPENGQKGGAVNNNFVYYKLIGNPDAYRPVPPENEYELVDPDQIEIDGWDLVFNDEFSGNTLDRNSWDYVTGYYLDNDPAKWGWGNNELEHYTDSTKNVYVKDGSLHLKATEDPKVFEDIDPNRTAPYASGKIASQNKFSFKYGRIDFRAKLPTGNGLWPALWLLPNDQDIYGTWAASGEIDVMEARGRLPGASSGAIHFGGTWPSNTYLGGDYAFPEGQAINTDYHVYSVIWEEESIQWFVDGEMFFYATADQWYSTSAPNNNLAPFDQEFYIIMNLAVGGWFDGGITPNAGDLPAEMQVDYVRVYQAEGDKNATHSGTNGAGGTPSTGTPSTEAPSTEAPTTQAPTTESGSSSDNKQETGTTGTIVDSVGDGTVGLNRKDGSVEFYVKGATFADLHYKVNDGGQVNVAMKNDGSGNFTYTVDGLKNGDKIDYFFTYNPGNGALDTAWASYTLTGTSSNTNTNTNTASKDGVVVYEDANYSGASAALGVGEYTLADLQKLGISNDSITSINLPLGYKVTVYQNDNFSGSSKVYSDMQPKLVTWNDRISSIVVEEAEYFIVNKNSGLVLDIEGKNKDNGGNVIQWNKNGGTNQKFKVVNLGNGYYQIVSVMNGKVMDVDDKSKENGANVHMWENNNGTNQQWSIDFVDGAYAYVVSRNSGKSLDADNWGTEAGGNVIQWQLGNMQANQLWKFELAN